MDGDAIRAEIREMAQELGPGEIREVSPARIRGGCASCLFYRQAMPKPETDVAYGRCRRRAPRLRGRFPVVFPSDWCGEHQFDAFEEILPL
jgi:hypothetical protein